MESASLSVGPVLIWLGIIFCISQSAMFSGLNLAFFSISRLQLEIEQANGNSQATRVLALRKDSNFLLTTVLWGNVAINVLLTLLSNSVMVGLVAFLFSTFAITIFGEILPQAYFSRNALRMASALSPVLRFYQWVFYVLAKPSALVLDAWLGKDSIEYMREKEVRHLIEQHIMAVDSDVDAVEGVGALNFLALDDTLLAHEGEVVAPASIMQLPLRDGRPVFPDAAEFAAGSDEDFARRVAAIPYRWLILVDIANKPVWALDSNSFLRAILGAGDKPVDPFAYCHHPIVVTDTNTRFGSVIAQLKGEQPAQSDAPIAPRIILLWAKEKRIITDSDILGRLFKDIGLFSALGVKPPEKDA